MAVNETPVDTPPDVAQADPGKQGMYNGLIQVKSARALEAEAEKAKAANIKPLIQGLAGHVKKCFDAAAQARTTDEQRMLANLRARRGQYDPLTLAKIKETKGSEVYMMLTSNKCRAATAWLRDTLLGNGTEKPWSISTTKDPELPPDMMDDAVARAGELVQQLQDMLGGPQMVPDSQVEDLLELARARGKVEVKLAADKGLQKMENKMEDQMQEGGFARAFSEWLDDLSTFPSAVFKGPVVRNKPQMTWVDDGKGGFEPKVETKLLLEWERVSPFDCYPAPGSANVNDGYFIERHKLRPLDLEELIGVEGYSEAAIREVIKAHGQGGLKDWTSLDSERSEAEGQDTSSDSDKTEPTIDALQFWGTVLGQDLLDFGIDKKQVKDVTKTYHCEVWLIGTWVIKATLNYDPFGRKPYYKASYENLPGAFWGNAPPDLIGDCQTLCNNAARSMANNIAIASGPQVTVNIDRVAAGTDPTNIYPWKVTQVTTDPYGSSAPATSYFQPNSNAAELMGIYEKFAVLADEYSGIPRYMTGDAAVGGAGRTASGMSMLMSNAGKSIKSVVANIDHVISDAVERLFYHNMKYGKDPELKRTDVKIVARGAASLVVKEQAQVRRNEFLGIVLNSPVAAQVLGEEAISDLLRTMAAGLDMDTDKLIPPPEVIKARLFQMRQQQAQQQQMGQIQAREATADAAATGIAVDQAKQVMSAQGQQLADGAAVSDSFSPQRQ